MTDRELLESAARAAGISHDGVGYLSSTGGPMNWNPLQDDGDALRLAVKLELAVQSCNQATTAAKMETSSRGNVRVVRADEHHGDDPYAATRRAITRAAAAIGEKVK